ncbi:MAG TPA: anti-sigma factor [Gammaproteobacteria bacterium]|nr:anti-sigma factor [Gammaproteobacteria bacterium]
MKSSDSAITEVDLHAYVDGQLDEDHRREIEALLQTDPDVAKKVRDCRELNEALHALYDPVLDEPIPRELMEAAAGNIGGHRAGPPRHRLWKAAAVVAAMSVGGLLGWYARGGIQARAPVAALPASDENTLDLAFLAHAVYTPEVRHPVEVGADEEKHLVAWLSKRLKSKVRAPRLSQLGYRLLGGRLVTSAEGPAALFMYQNDKGNRLTLFVYQKNTGGDTAFRYAKRNGIQAFYWVEGDLGYVLAGTVDRPVISKAAHEVYEQLNW